MDIGAGISAATQALAIARTLRDVERAYDAVTLKGQIVDLMDKLLDIRSAFQDAQQELTHSRSEIENLKSAFQTRSTTVSQGGFRYEANATDPSKPRREQQRHH